MNKLIENLKINRLVKEPKCYSAPCYEVEVMGTTFISPVECYNSYLLGLGTELYKTCVGDNRYKLIENWLVKNVIPGIRKHSNKSISSYILKHLCENCLGGYVSNESIKYILSLYEMPVENNITKYDINIRYKITKGTINKLCEMSDVSFKLRHKYRD